MRELDLDAAKPLQRFPGTLQTPFFVAQDIELQRDLLFGWVRSWITSPRRRTVSFSTVPK